MTRRHRIAATVLGLVTLGCARDDPRAPAPATSAAAVEPERTPPPNETARSAGGATSAEAKDPAAPASKPVSATIIDVDAQAGPLDDQLAAIAVRAKKEQRPLAVELWASWCPPCKTFDKLVDSGQLDAALTGTMLVRVDVDMFDDELSELGFRAPQIPSLYRVDGRGRPTGKPLSGASWHERSAEEIGAALTAFFAAP